MHHRYLYVLQDQSGEMPCSFCVAQTQMRLRHVSASVVIAFYVCTNRITLSHRHTCTNPDVKWCAVKKCRLTPNKQYWLFFFPHIIPAIGQTWTIQLLSALMAFLLYLLHFIVINFAKFYEHKHVLLQSNLSEGLEHQHESAQLFI